MYVLGRVWRRRASEFGPRAKTWASCNALEVRSTRLAQHLLAPLQAGALTPPLNPPLRGLQSRGAYVRRLFTFKLRPRLGCG